MSIPDHILNQYTNELWGKYDVNKSGTLQPWEMHWIFNDLFVRLGEPRLFSGAEILALFKMADKNSDGHVDKKEFFNLCKYQLKRNPCVQKITVYHAPPVNYHYGYLVQRDNHRQMIVIRR